MPEPHDCTQLPATVLVCTRGRGELIRECLAAVKIALRPGDELLVVEAETAAARPLVEQLDDDRCRWLAAPRPGKSRQLNLGIDAARGDLVLITDDDCIVPPEWVSAMSFPFAEPDVGIAFGPVDGLTQLAGSEPARLRSGPAPTHAWAFSHGASMALRRSAVLEAGGFDERIGPGTPVHGEEADLLLRTQSAGWRCWIADGPAVRHLEWRTELQDRRNLIAYERGGGAWAGAALRRDPRGAASAIATRLRYQAGHFHGSEPQFALASQAAFAGGLLRGLRLAPARFLDAEPGAPRPPAADPRRLPWPALSGRRCLVVTAAPSTIAADLRTRGASEVVQLGPAMPLTREFDVIITDRLSDTTDDPLAAFRAFVPGCLEALLSIERIDLLRSITARGRPRHRGALNGAAHRQLLVDAGFEPRLASRPWRGADGLERALLAYPAG